MNDLIMVVDDEPNFRNLIRHHLERHNYRVIEAATGKEAIESLNIASNDGALPALIIMDVVMPEQDGVDACRTIRKDKRFSSIPIIMLTAKKELGDKLTGLVSGANRYMVKPMDINKLLELIQIQINQTGLSKKTIYDEIDDFASSKGDASHE